MSRRFSSVLVANRGEIAVRVLRGAREQGYRAIAVYSEVDRDAPHVALADEAVLLGPAPASESYLNVERIIDAARRTGAEAIHPGYGFLSENAAFAQACVDAGLTFIGPSVEAIEIMGNKAAAKRRMQAAGVPCLPGYEGEDQSLDALEAAARSIGAPLMVKAAAGGGGRGMRLVEDLDSLSTAITAARSEAGSAFGSGELILEKALLEPRHVEIQVLGDTHGEVVHLGERDCSVQRRHQKVIEESPCPVMTETLREAMGSAAVAAARDIDYVGAGTVEFLLDADGGFYFLEMNTRLQVEHPVTEAVTGLDLVALQLQVAQGERLPVVQDEIALTGHAIEVRLYAEDADADFLPASGTVHAWTPPVGEGIRVDHGLAAGQQVSPFYDPMIAKLVAFGSNRETARRRLLRALDNTVVQGLPTNRQFLVEALQADVFAAGGATTAFIGETFPAGFRATPPTDEMHCLAALLQFLKADERSVLARVHGDPWTVPGDARSLPSQYVYARDNALCTVSVSSLGNDTYRAQVDNANYDIDVVDLPGEGQLRVSLGGIQRTLAYCFCEPAVVELLWRGMTARFCNVLAVSDRDTDTAGSGAIVAPMHGNLLTVSVEAGQSVATGTELAVMEAMKMEHRLLADMDGIVSAVHATAGDQLSAGALVMELKATDE